MAAVDVALPVPVQVNFRVTGVSSQDVGNNQVKFTIAAHRVKYVIVNVLHVNLNTDFLSISLGSFCIQRQLGTAAVEYEVDFQVLAVFINIAVAVGIFPACFSQQLLSIFRIVSIRILQLVKAIVQGRRNRCFAGDKGIFQQNLVVGFAVQALNQSSTNLRIMQRFAFVHIDLSQYGTQRSNFGNVIFSFIFEELQVTGSDVDSEVDFTFLQCHSTGVRIVDSRDFSIFERNLAIPVFFVSNHYCFSLAVGFYSIRTGADRTFFFDITVGYFSINHDEQRVSQHARQSRYRFFGFDDQVLAISFDFSILEDGLSTGVQFKGSFNGLFCNFSSQLIAIGEANLIVNVEGPGQFIVGNRPFISQPRSSVHFFVEFNQAFAQAVTHYNPAEEVIGRIQVISKVGYTEFYYFVGYSCFFIATAAACCCKCH